MSQASFESVPGVIVHYVPASTGQYVGCPSIVILPTGEYIASHSHFGPGAANTDSFIYLSRNQGQSWKTIAKLEGQIWSNLFSHEGSLYIMGTDHCDNYGGRLNGRVVIRRSDDKGRSWTNPVDERSGLLADQDGYHTAPVPVVEHRNRIWRAMEFAPEKERRTWRAFVMSAPSDSDLLDGDNWTFSEQYEHLWSDSQWIEGNIVVAPDGSLVNILRTNYRGDARFYSTDPEVARKHMDRAAILHVSADGKRLTHDREKDLIDFPGGGTKFTIRYDQASDLYWSLVNKQRDPPARRNALYLSSSTDLRMWQVRRRLLFHPDTENHAFQYVDWVFEGQHIAFASRTAYDDGIGGAHNYHDANFLTFHRIHNFRKDTDFYR